MSSSSSLRFPSRIEPVRFPLFGMCWYGNPSNGDSIIAYCGGGGSAKTGVSNAVVLIVATQEIASYRRRRQRQRQQRKQNQNQEEEEEEEDSAEEKYTISTNDQVGVDVLIYSNPISGRIYMVVALGNDVHRYRIHLPTRGDTTTTTTTNNDNEDIDPDVDATDRVVVDDDDHHHHRDKNIATLDGILHVGGGCNALAVNALANQLAVGCEDGSLKVYSMSEEGEDNNNDAFTITITTTINNNNSAETNQQQVQQPLYVYLGHEKAICSVAFSMHGNRLVSSAKDGTARVWKDGIQIDQLNCSIDDPKSSSSSSSKVSSHNKKKKQPPQILVRGCSFGDLEGKIIYTIASGRRGKAYLSKWIQQQQQQQEEYNNNNHNNNHNSGGGDGGGNNNHHHHNNNQFQCIVRTECNQDPISAMSISQDALMMSFGTVSGSIILWNVSTWKPIKIFHEVHELPVTCIAVRPYTNIALQDDDYDGIIQYNARSASADSKFACLTIQRKVPNNKKKKKKKRKNKNSSSSSSSSQWKPILFLHRIFIWGIILWLFSPIIQEANDKCSATLPPNIIHIDTTHLNDIDLNNIFHTTTTTPSLDNINTIITAISNFVSSIRFNQYYYLNHQHHEHNNNNVVIVDDIISFLYCLRDDFLIAPTTRTGITRTPY